MARIPENDIERLKEEVSVARLVEASGIELKKSGKTTGSVTNFSTFHPAYGEAKGRQPELVMKA